MRNAQLKQAIRAGYRTAAELAAWKRANRIIKGTI